MFKVFLIVIFLIAIAFVCLAVGIIVKGKFPDTHVGRNAEMKKLGIACAKNDGAYCQGQPDSDDCKGCCNFHQ